MGNAIRRVTHTAIRPIKEYNLYERAHKAVIKNKYVPSPKHPSTQEIIQKSINELPPEAIENLSCTDPSLQERLRQVYVMSQDVTPLQPPPRQHPDRPLPLNRGYYKAPEYGFVEPKVVPYGKVTLKNALQFITAHQNDPDINTADSIALKHKLDQRLTEQVLQHFVTFRLFLPAQPTEEQVKILKRLNAVPTALPNSVDLKQRLQGVAMGNADHETLPQFLFPEPAPEPFKVTLLKPSPKDLRLPTFKFTRAKDEGMDPYIAQAQALPLEDVGKDSGGRSSSDAVPEPAPEPFKSTMLRPSPNDLRFPTSEFTRVKDEGMDQYIAQAQPVPLEVGGKDSGGRSSSDAVKATKVGVSRRSADDVTQAKNYVPIGKDKNADAT